MSKKISSYQKLKNENEQLRQDIYNLIRLPEMPEGISTKAAYELSFKMSDIVWLGEATHIDEKKFQGLTPRINSTKIITETNEKTHRSFYRPIKRK